MPFLLPGRAKVELPYKLYSFACQSKKGKNMTLYQWGEDDMFDLQRMPRKTGSDGSADDPSPQHLQRMYGENVRPVVLMEDPIFHTDNHPFCPDWSCTCHEEDQEAIARVAQWVKDGLLTPDEATQSILGRTF